jgi:hypothetical protein
MIEILTGSDYWETIAFTWSAITYPLTWDGSTLFSEISVASTSFSLLSTASTSYSEQLTTSTTFTEA